MRKVALSEKDKLIYPYLVQKILHRFGVPMHTEEMTTNTGWNHTFGERLFKQCGMKQLPTGVWVYKAGPPPPEVPLQDDAEPGALDPTQPPPEPAEPEGGWTLRDVMSALHHIKWRGDTQAAESAARTRSHLRWQRRMSTRVEQLESSVTAIRAELRSMQGGDPPGDEAEEDEEEEEDSMEEEEDDDGDEETHSDSD